MGFNIKEILGTNINIEESPDEELELHRTKHEIVRPNCEVKLESIYTDVFEPKKTQSDPTPDLIVLEAGVDKCFFRSSLPESGYLVYDVNTTQTWLAPTKLCLDANFIYRADLEIIEYSSREEAWVFYKSRGYLAKPGVSPRVSCYILDNPPNETYEVYYDSTYVVRVYGCSTPQGCFVHKYKNRFHRDMAILQLDKLYSEASKKAASKLTKRDLANNEAIIISDGAYMKDVTSCSIVFIDNERVLKCSEGRLPSEMDQAVLISEIRGATLALTFCKLFNKKKVTYYYDNTSIVNVFKNRKTEYIEEIVEYKKLLEELQSKGFKVNFVELHPKTGENRDTENKALMFFHNGCDSECRIMCDVFKRDYRSYATAGSTDGKTYDKIKEENKPKGKPKQYNSKPYNGRR